MRNEEETTTTATAVSFARTEHKRGRFSWALRCGQSHNDIHNRGLLELLNIVGDGANDDLALRTPIVGPKDTTRHVKNTCEKKY